MAAFCGSKDLYLVELGIAYKYNGKMYLANPQYCQLLMTLGYFSDFKSLEDLAEYVLSAGCHCLNIPATTERCVQTAYAEEFPTTGVVLVRLKINHPAIDHLVIDNISKTLYMVQTSYQKYSDHLKDTERLNAIGEKSVKQHYKDITKCRCGQYIYATYRPTKVQDRQVTVLSLNAFPELLQHPQQGI